MKTKADLVKGWILKAESDLTNARLCLSAGQALDTACFHAQQANESRLPGQGLEDVERSKEITEGKNI